MSENEEKKQEVNVSSNQEEVENAKKKYRKPAIDKKKKQEYEDSLIQEWRRTCTYMRYRDEKTKQQQEMVVETEPETAEENKKDDKNVIEEEKEEEKEKEEKKETVKEVEKEEKELKKNSKKDIIETKEEEEEIDEKEKDKTKEEKEETKEEEQQQTKEEETKDEKEKDKPKEEKEKEKTRNTSPNSKQTKKQEPTSKPPSAATIDKLLNHASRGRVEKVMYYLDWKKVPVDSRNSRGMTALYCACEEGQSKCVKELLSRNPNICIPDIENERTPLHAIATNGNSDRYVECAKLLIEYYNKNKNNFGNVDYLNLVDKYGMTAVIAAAQTGWSALHYAAYNNDIHTAEVLLQSGAKKDITDKEKMTPQEWAETDSKTQVAVFIKKFKK